MGEWLLGAAEEERGNGEASWLQERGEFRPERGSCVCDEVVLSAYRQARSETMSDWEDVFLRYVHEKWSVKLALRRVVRGKP